MAKRKVHFVLGTHWDREWHHTFQDFRYYLVKLIDELLEGWNNGSLQGPFQADGQAIILKDYLEIHPERRSVQVVLAQGLLFQTDLRRAYTIPLLHYWAILVSSHPGNRLG